jgi:hypothetical protein
MLHWRMLVMSSSMSVIDSFDSVLIDIMLACGSRLQKYGKILLEFIMFVLVPHSVSARGGL